MYPFFSVRPVDHALIVLSSFSIPSHQWTDVASSISLQVKGECKGEATYNQGLIEEFMAAHLHPSDKEKGMELMRDGLEDEGLGELFVSILSFAWEPYPIDRAMAEAQRGLNYCLTP